jgi:hypothetical protein
MTDVIAAPAQARVPVRGGGTFPVRRIFCVGRNFADHAKEMGAPGARFEGRTRPARLLHQAKRRDRRRRCRAVCERDAGPAP